MRQTVALICCRLAALALAVGATQAVADPVPPTRSTEVQQIWATCDSARFRMLCQSSTAELDSITAALRGDLDAHTAALRAYCDQRVAARTEYSAVSVRRLLADRLGHPPVLDGSVDYRTELQTVFSSGPSHFVLEGSGAPDAPFIYGTSYGLNADPSTRSAAIVLHLCTSRSLCP